MQFIVIPHNGSQDIEVSDYPTAVLTQDNWDDFRYKTTFFVRLYLSPIAILDLHAVKILSPGGLEGWTQLPERFNELPVGFASLGQEYTYYETLLGLNDRRVSDDYLNGLRDVVFDRQIYYNVRDFPGFTKSLLRNGSAERALLDARAIFDNAEVAVQERSEEPVHLSFGTNVGGSHFTVPLTFLHRNPLPGRINAVIGYNGCGKTTLLAKLAMVADADKARRSELAFSEEYGEFVSSSEPVFGATIAVSYSAFDTFSVPENEGDRTFPDKPSNTHFGYVYCGLRRTESGSENLILKTVSEIEEEFVEALARATVDPRRPILVRALFELSREPSFASVTTRDFLAGDLGRGGLVGIFRNLSTGHKIVLNIIVQLVAYLQPGSLVLIDEPESHLHPPLLAALLHSVRMLLDERNSLAVVATHSPVVLQEVPKQYVRVLRRSGSVTTVEAPEAETFGENVGYLTRTVFNLDSSATDYHSVLTRLAQSLPLHSIEELFDGEMSAQARSFVVSVQRRQGTPLS